MMAFYTQGSLFLSFGVLFHRADWRIGLCAVMKQNLRSVRLSVEPWCITRLNMLEDEGILALELMKDEQ